MNNIFPHWVRNGLILIALVAGLRPTDAVAIQGGARPLAMGGAYVAVAEDAYAVVWNPAAIAVLEEAEAVYSGTVNKREAPVVADLVADDFFSWVYPLWQQPNEKGVRRGVLGISFQNSIGKGLNSEIQLMQPSLAYGIRISETVSVGAALTYAMFDATVPNVTQTQEIVSADLGLLWDVNEELSVGVVVDNVTEPDLELFGVTNKINRIVKAGVAYYPTMSMLITCDIYDVFGATEDKSTNLSQNVRLGGEYYLNDTVAVRAGAQHLFSDSDAAVAYTGGLGLQHADFVGIRPVTYYLDYAFLYWPDATTGFEDYIHHVGISVRY